MAYESLRKFTFVSIIHPRSKEESFRKYKDYETLLNSYSQEENDAKEAHFDYLDRKMKMNKLKGLKEELNKAEK